MNKQYRDQYVCRPAMNRADQPTESDFRHDELDTFESVLRTGPVIKQQQDSRYDLNRKQEQGHSSEVVPDRMPMNWNFLFPGEPCYDVQAKTSVEPVPQRIGRRGVHDVILARRRCRRRADLQRIVLKVEGAVLRRFYRLCRNGRHDTRTRSARDPDGTAPCNSSACTRQRTRARRLSVFAPAARAANR